MYAPPARISAATQMASMSSSRVAPCRIAEGDGLETRRDGHVRLCTAYNLTELNCLSRVCETQATMLPPIAADPDMLPDSAWLLLSMI